MTDQRKIRLLTKDKALELAKALWVNPPDSVVDHQRREAWAMVKAQVKALDVLLIPGCACANCDRIQKLTRYLRGVLKELQ
jgi:hypothetical protein